MFRWVIICISISTVADAQRTKASQEQRIVGGQDATSYQIPFQVSLFRSGNFICGGSIISRSFILTAAHCTTKDPEPSHYMVRTGSRVTWQGGQEHLVRRVIPHERYKQLKGIIENDICVLEIYPPIAFDSKQQPVALATDAEALPARSEVWVSGYGKPAENRPATKTLMVVKLPVIDWDECYNFYTNQKMSMTRDFICAGVKDNSLNSCQGDSGGPLYTKAKVQVGIVSWGVGCTKPLYPGAYTNVSFFKKWIIQKLAEKGERPIFESALRLKDIESGPQRDGHVDAQFGDGLPGWPGPYEPLVEPNNHLPGSEMINPVDTVLGNLLGTGYSPSHNSEEQILSSLISRYYPQQFSGSCNPYTGACNSYSNYYSPYSSYYIPYSNYYSPYSQNGYSSHYG